MSADRYSLFNCLTETGWSLIEQASRPDGWIRIYELEVYQGSPFGRESRTWHLIETHPDWNNDAADILEKKFPRPERSRELSAESLKALGITTK
jgi:hypothetical protein